MTHYVVARGEEALGLPFAVEEDAGYTVVAYCKTIERAELITKALNVMEALAMAGLKVSP